MKGYNESVDIYNKKKAQNQNIGEQHLKDYLWEIKSKNSNKDEPAESGQHLSKHLDEHAIDLILKMLEYDPNKRITAK